jgi:DhnA family fructose-bisphosphate aldolase class Ia
MSGGPKTDTSVEFLETLKGAMDGGAAGVAVGRNIWQHKTPEKILEAVNRVVHHDEDPQTAAADLE